MAVIPSIIDKRSFSIIQPYSSADVTAILSEYEGLALCYGESETFVFR